MRRIALLGALAALPACSGDVTRLGVDEPVFVRGATLRGGDLPGLPEGDGGAPDGGGLPVITSLETSNNVVQPGQAGKLYLGRISPSALSVGVRLDDLGRGWWMVPVGAADPSFNNELTFQFTADFGADLAPGIHRLNLVALDENGRGGPQRTQRVCVLPAVPDNLNACDPSLAPPDTVISLSWDTDVDLDLLVVTPEGKVVRWRNPTTAQGDGGAPTAPQLADPTTGVLDRNSNGQCVLDRIRRESLVWQGEPRAGTYRVYANLFDACGRASVRYRVEVLRRASLPPDGRTHAQRETARREGVLTSLAANGGRALGTFVLDVPLP
ncbi:MAG: hypothetical protein U0325_30865 [Polyangiales bacterium]